MADLPQKPEVLAFMRKTGWGYKRTAKHFGLSVNTVKDWGRELRTGGVTPPDTPPESGENVHSPVMGGSRAHGAPPAGGGADARPPARARKAPRAIVIPDVPVTADSRLSETQRQALGLLLDGRTVDEVAVGLGVTVAEVEGWQKQPVFAGVLAELRRRRVMAVADELGAAAPEALRALRDIITGVEKADRGVVAAAVAVLDRAGFPKVERIEHTGLGGDRDDDLDGMTPEQLAEEEERLLASRVRGAG